MGGFNFREGTYNVPSGSRPKHLKTRPKPEFTDGKDGRNIKSVLQCSSYFVGIIDKVYTYFYMY